MTDPKARPRAPKRSAVVGGARDDGGLVDVFLTAPIFVVYHLGVVFLNVRNGLDPITDTLLSVLHRSLPAYLGVTLLVAALLYAAFRWTKIGGKVTAWAFLLRIGESAVYAFLMATAARAAVAHTLAATRALSASHTLAAAGGGIDPLSAVILSSGAGFYEELAFRVILFGGLAWGVHKIAKSTGGKILGEVGVAFFAAACFSAIHYVGSLGDAFTLSSFVFRLVCGLALTAVFRFRGFAAAVWTHALYDVAVMTF